MNETMEIMENVTDVVTEEAMDMTPINCEAEGSNVAITVAKVLLVGGAILGVVLLKKKDAIARKIDESRIKKLTKKGYIISLPEEACEVIDDEPECEEAFDAE